MSPHERLSQFQILYFTVYSMYILQSRTSTETGVTLNCESRPDTNPQLREHKDSTIMSFMTEAIVYIVPQLHRVSCSCEGVCVETEKIQDGSMWKCRILRCEGVRMSGRMGHRRVGAARVGTRRRRLAQSARTCARSSRACRAARRARGSRRGRC